MVDCYHHDQQQSLIYIIKITQLSWLIRLFLVHSLMQNNIYFSRIIVENWPDWIREHRTGTGFDPLCHIQWRRAPREWTSRSPESEYLWSCCRRSQPGAGGDTLWRTWAWNRWWDRSPDRAPAAPSPPLPLPPLIFFFNYNIISF